MLSSAFWMEMVPLGVFLGLVGLGLALNRVLPANTGPELPKRWLWGLTGVFLLLAFLLIVLYVIAIA